MSHEIFVRYALILLVSFATSAAVVSAFAYLLLRGKIRWTPPDESAFHQQPVVFQEETINVSRKASCFVLRVPAWNPNDLESMEEYLTNVRWVLGSFVLAISQTYAVGSPRRNEACEMVVDCLNQILEVWGYEDQPYNFVFNKLESIVTREGRCVYQTGGIIL